MFETVFGILVVIFILIFTLVTVTIAVVIWKTARLSGKILRTAEEALDRPTNGRQAFEATAARSKCQHCGSAVEQGSKCPNCGADLG
jgi:methionyl-tRNA synthetase